MVGTNVWTEKTLGLVEKGDYLDRLLEIYPAKLPPSRPLPREVRDEIRRLCEEKKYEELTTLLLDLDHPFPIEHPYAALLRHLDRKVRSEVMRRNPKVVEELASLLASLGPNNIIRGIERPKDINRMLGAAFRQWVSRKFVDRPFKVVDDPNRLLLGRGDEVCIYVGSDVKIAKFIESHLGLREPSLFRRDLIARVGDLYIVGEARFLTTPGGSQTRDLNDTLDFVERVEGLAIDRGGVRVKGVALLDGVVWFHEPYKELIRQRAVGDRVVMTALLLEEYLLSLVKSRRPEEPP